MIGRILLDNDTWLITMGLFGGTKITLKWRGLTRRASRGERQYLSGIIEAVRSAGVPIEPGSERVEAVLNDFAEAVFGGHARWRVFFTHVTPEQMAKEYMRLAPQDEADDGPPRE